MSREAIYNTYTYVGMYFLIMGSHVLFVVIHLIVFLPSRPTNKRMKLHHIHHANKSSRHRAVMPHHIPQFIFIV